MGKSPGGSFQAIQEYFRRQACRFCANHFAPDGIQLIREEPGMLVVRVGCVTCGKPLGVAIVGTAKGEVETGCPSDWTKKDVQKLGKMPAITYDDVLAAHEFFESLGPDWYKHLGRGRRRQVS